MALGLLVPWRREGGWPPPTRTWSRCGRSAGYTEQVSQPVFHACPGRFLFLFSVIEMTLPEVVLRFLWPGCWFRSCSSCRSIQLFLAPRAALSACFVRLLNVYFEQ